GCTPEEIRILVRPYGYLAAVAIVQGAGIDIGVFFYKNGFRRGRCAAAIIIPAHAHLSAARNAAGANVAAALEYHGVRKDFGGAAGSSFSQTAHIHDPAVDNRARA